MRIDYLKKLGEGSSAEVFLATMSTEHGFQREVAVKRLHAELLDDKTQVESFISEAKLLSQLNHPNIAAVLDFGFEENAPYQVLEYVDGPSVQSIFNLIDEGQIDKVPPAIALHIVNEVTNALDYVHGAQSSDGEPLGIVHRDINPTNILITRTGNIKLTDFGIAKAIPRARNTALGVVRGTVAYMSPEQLRFEEADARTDLYALGLILHALLCGAQPGDNTAGQSPALSPALPEDLRCLIERATQTSPARRYPQASQMSADCWRALTARLNRDARQTMADWLQAHAGSITVELEKSILASDTLPIREHAPATRERAPAAIGDDGPTAIEIPSVRLSSSVPSIAPAPRPRTNRLDPSALFAMSAASEDGELRRDRVDTALVNDGGNTELKPHLQASADRGGRAWLAVLVSMVMLAAALAVLWAR